MEQKIDYADVANRIRKELKKYIVENKLQALVIGESGGIDSALASALAYPVCIELGIELIGRSISIVSNRPEEIERGRLIGKYFTTNFKEINLTELYQHEKHSLEIGPDDLKNDYSLKIRLGNVKARMRMIYLYDLAQKYKGLVLSTDNYTELLLGFWTRFGDQGDYGMIQNIWKTEVYELAEWIVTNELNESPEAAVALQSCIDATATDGLGITSSDLDQILPDWKERHSSSRTGYAEVDSILQNKEKFPNHPVVQRHKGTEWKRLSPINIERSTIILYD